MPSGRYDRSLGRLERQLIEAAASKRAGELIRGLGLDPLAPYGGLECLPRLADVAEPVIFARAVVALALRRAGTPRLRCFILREVRGGQAGRVYRDAFLHAFDVALDEFWLLAEHWQRDRWGQPDSRAVARIAERTVDAHLAGQAQSALAGAEVGEIVRASFPEDRAALERRLARGARLPADAPAFALQRHLLASMLLALAGDRARERITEARVARAAAARRARRLRSLEQELFT